MDKQRSTKHTHRNKYRVKRTQRKAGCVLRCSGRVTNSPTSLIYVTFNLFP